MQRKKYLIKEKKPPTKTNLIHFMNDKCLPVNGMFVNWFVVVVVVFAHVVAVVRPKVGGLLLSLSPLTHGENQRAER